MKLNREGVQLNAEERNKRNQNWATLEVELDGIGEKIADSGDAKELAENVQAQVNALVVQGDSSVEARQARVDAKGVEAATLKARLDAEQNAVTQQLAETIKKDDTGVLKLNAFTEEDRAVIQGLAVGEINAVLGEKNVKNINIDDRAVGIEKTGFSAASKNLFQGKYTSGVMAFAGAVLGGTPDRLRFRSNLNADDGKIAIIPLVANETLTIKVHEPLKKTYFKVAIHNSLPVFGSFQDADRLIINDDTKNEVTFTNDGLGKYLMVYVSLTGQEPKLQVEKGSIATSYQSHLVIGSEYINIKDIQLSQLSNQTTTELKRLIAADQASLMDKPSVHFTFDGDLQDKTTGEVISLTGTPKTHPLTGVSIPADTPTFVGLNPKRGANMPFKIIDASPLRWIGWAVKGNRIFGFEGMNLLYSDDGGTTISTLYAFSQRIDGVWVTDRGSLIVCVSDESPPEENASLANAKLYRSTNNGDTWTQVIGLNSGMVRNNCFDSLGDVCYAAEYGGRALPNNSSHVYKSVDDGATWTEIVSLDSGSPLHVHLVRINPNTPSQVYAASGDMDASSVIWRSQDAGATWAKLKNYFGSQEFRQTDIVFDKENAYFGGDGYVGGGQRFGIYKLRLSDDQWSKMIDIQGPVYSMKKDLYGNVWAAVMASQDIPSVPNPGGADWTSIYMLYRGQWIEISRLEGLGVSGGISQLAFDPVRGIYATGYKTDVFPERGSLLYSHDAAYHKGLFVGTGDKLKYSLSKELSSQFSMFCTIKATEDLSTMVSGDTRTVLMIGTNTDHYLLTISELATDLQRIVIRKSKQGQTSTIAFPASIDIKKHDTVSIGITENNGVLKIYVMERRTGKLHTATMSTPFTVPAKEIRFGYDNVSPYLFKNLQSVIGDFELYEKVLGDGEIVRKLRNRL